MKMREIDSKRRGGKFAFVARTQKDRRISRKKGHPSLSLAHARHTTHTHTTREELTTVWTVILRRRISFSILSCHIFYFIAEI
jgi:hypothetical protein